MSPSPPELSESTVPDTDREGAKQFIASAQADGFAEKIRSNANRCCEITPKGARWGSCAGATGGEDPGGSSARRAPLRPLHGLHGALK